MTWFDFVNPVHCDAMERDGVGIGEIYIGVGEKVEIQSKITSYYPFPKEKKEKKIRAKVGDKTQVTEARLKSEGLISWSAHLINFFNKNTWHSDQLQNTYTLFSCKLWVMFLNESNHHKPIRYHAYPFLPPSPIALLFSVTT